MVLHFPGFIPETGAHKGILYSCAYARSYDQVNVVRNKRVVACVLHCAGVCLCCAAVHLCRMELVDVMRAGSVYAIQLVYVYVCVTYRSSVVVRVCVTDGSRKVEPRCTGVLHVYVSMHCRIAAASVGVC